MSAENPILKVHQLGHPRNLYLKVLAFSYTGDPMHHHGQQSTGSPGPVITFSGCVLALLFIMVCISETAPVNVQLLHGQILSN
jgi:hypothetical protein